MSALTQPAASSPAGATTARQEPMLEISNRMGRLHKQAFGRGPTQCRALFADHQSLVVILEQTLTVSERNLLAMGEIARLHESRMFAQSALEHEARAIIEEVLQRRTLAFITGLDPRRDMTLHFFTLAAD